MVAQLLACMRQNVVHRHESQLTYGAARKEGLAKSLLTYPSMLKHHLYLRYLERYMAALTAARISCGFGRAVATPDSYAFLATAHPTFAEISLMSRKSG